MFRTFVLPVVLMGIVGAPVLYSHHQRRSNRPGNVQVQSQQQTPWQTAGFRFEGAGQINPRAAVIPGAGLPPTNLASPVSTGFPPQVSTPTANIGSNAQYIQTAQPFGSIPNSSSASTSFAGTPTFLAGENQAWNQPGMVPDFAKAETVFFPGDAHGPDLTAHPISPTIDLASLFRFDITEQAITSRWDRVSTSSVDQGLHGLRVALVTGTNSWDLHGSLTYYFDANHRVQRITYRGWTGDPSQLLQILQQSHQLRAQPTHWAGLYLAKRSGLLMKRPAVIDRKNPVQQLALILELNNPRGNTALSNDFQRLLPAAKAGR